MGFSYTFSTDPKPMGEYDQKFGQTFWANVNEMDMPVMFNSQERFIDLEDKIEAEEQVMKKSAKGTEYYRLKKVKVNKAYGNKSAAQPELPTEDKPAPSTGGKVVGDLVLQLDRIEKQQTLIIEKLNTLMGEDDGGN